MAMLNVIENNARLAKTLYNMFCRLTTIMMCVILLRSIIMEIMIIIFLIALSTM